MKIEKFNENQQQDELDDFIEMIINKFYPDDDLNNMASYDCEFATRINKKVALIFHFMALDEDEIKIMQDITEYLVIASGPNHLLILEKIDMEPNVLLTKHIYTFNKDSNKIITIDMSLPEYSDYNNKYRLLFTMPDNTIKYQSDDLDDIFEKVKLLGNTNKYGL